MRVKILLRFISVIAIALIVMACSSDDDADFVPVELNDRTEQQAADKDSLMIYFSTHYYNASDFQDTTVDYNIDDIIISELPKDENGNYLPLPDPENNKLLSEPNVLTTYTESYLDVSYEYYVLRINNGGGDASPKFTDRVRATYEGSFVETGEVFDSAVNPVDFNLVGGLNSSGVITGWQRVFPKFNAAESFIEAGDGTIDYNNYGLGVMFLPSGLAYFAGSSTIPAYSNLIFKFSLLQTETNDHDGDGIPSHVEDLDEDFEVGDEDTDEDLFPNYIDADDDGDGVPTRNELFRTTYPPISSSDPEPTYAENEFVLSRTEVDGMVTIVTGTIIDSDGNDVMDHLDADVSIDYSVSS